MYHDVCGVYATNAGREGALRRGRRKCKYVGHSFHSPSKFPSKHGLLASSAPPIDTPHPTELQEEVDLQCIGEVRSELPSSLWRL